MILPSSTDAPVAQEPAGRQHGTARARTLRHAIHLAGALPTELERELRLRHPGARTVHVPAETVLVLSPHVDGVLAAALARLEALGLELLEIREALPSTRTAWPGSR